jgi:Bacterial Ig domain/Secretion system C-terminal sorting domain
MKRIIILIAITIAAAGSFAQTSENFNSRPGTDLTQVKGFLQSNCWQFPDFDINNGGWDPGIEGDGAMVSGPGNSSTESTGIYTQLLTLYGNTNVSFKYKFSANVTDRRWIIVYLTGGNNNILFKVDSVELTGASGNTVYTYNKTIGQGSGCYKVYINYRGIGGEERIAIDELSFNVPTCFSTGCNQPPVAENDYFPGTNNRAASGNVLPNDYDPENGVITAQLVANSTDGNVVLNSFGTFTFTPNAGFKGPNTSFTYMVCDNNVPALCSNTATVLITFPTEEGSLPSSIIDLGAAYKNGKVNVKWTSTFEVNSDHFEIQRSTDGINFKTVGSIKGQGISSIKHEYQFDDDVKQSTLNKNDLYYRLKQVDLDTKASLSKVLVVRVYQTKSLQSVSVTPNPTFNDIKVNLQLNENSYIVLKVANSNGLEIMRKSTHGNTGTNNLTLEGTSRLQAGVYFLEVIVNSNERMMVKLIKN